MNKRKSSLVDKEEMILAAVNAQAENPGLWCINLPGDEENWITAGEAYLQRNLRLLHLVIENGDKSALNEIIEMCEDLK